jgi:hypothetical protein
MAKLIGRFYFKQTSNDNLIGEFSNNKADDIYTESADLRKGTKGRIPFIGTYDSTWQVNESPNYAKLIIENNHRPNPQIYSLTWTQKDKTIYRGEAMLCDGILIGDYREV